MNDEVGDELIQLWHSGIFTTPYVFFVDRL